MDVLSTRLTARFGSRYPLACAGMAFAAGAPALAVAVCDAGGIGAIGAGLTPAEPRGPGPRRPAGPRRHRHHDD